jgi:hypothetical protein
MEVIYVFNNTEETSKLKIPADSIEQINGWILALWKGKVVGGVKEEYLQAFYLISEKEIGD